MIEGFTVEKDVIHILLKGAQ